MDAMICGPVEERDGVAVRWKLWSRNIGEI
jgi:hypothetical protein